MKIFDLILRNLIYWSIKILMMGLVAYSYNAVVRLKFPNWIVKNNYFLSFYVDLTVYFDYRGYTTFNIAIETKFTVSNRRQHYWMIIHNTPAKPYC